MPLVKWTWRPAVERTVAFILLTAVLQSFGGCGMMSADNCSVGRQIAERDGGAGCAVARRTREAMFSGDDYPRLWTGEEARASANVDSSTLNAGPRSSGPGRTTRGFLGSLRVDIPESPATTDADIQDIRRYGGARFNPDEKVAVNFKAATIDFFLQQMLTGALGLPYVAADNLGGSITFRTEEPLSKGQILQVVRDILARQGLVMKNLNGVFHIDRGETIAATEGASRAGREGDQITRIVAVPHGNAAEIAEIVRGLTPVDVTLIPVGRGEIAVKASTQGDLDSVSELVGSLASRAVGEDSVAIIPLKQAGPTRIAAELEAFYKERLGKGGANNVTIIPLETQNALLVGARDKSIMAGLRQLVAQLDRSTTDEMTVRIITLTNLQAKDTAESLSAILGLRGSQAGSSGQNGSSSDRRGLGAGGSMGFGAAGSSSSVVPPVSPSWPYGSLSDTQSNDASRSQAGVDGAAAGSRGESGGSRSGRADSGAGGASPDSANVRIEPDVRTNTLLIYSNYSMFKRVQEIVRTLDVPQSQVVIEATIAEVTLTDDLQYGVQAYLTGNGFTVRNSIGTSPTDPGTNGGFAGIGFTVGSVRANVLLHALQTITSVKVISSPYLTVLDKRTARLVVGDQIPFAQTNQTSNNAGTTTITENIQQKDTGVVFEVTPTINANNSITLTIDQQISTPAQDAFTGNKTPVISTREVKSDVLVQSGRTFVLGGMMQERLDKSETATPALRSVPVLGEMFKPSVDNKATRVELLVLITPRVVRQSNDIERITRLLRDQIHVR